MSKKRDLPTVSAVLIVKDEEDVLDACLASVAWADEIVVYDTGSTDTTVEIARRHTDKVIEGFWDDDFAAARNRALDHATGDWVLSIDADEVFEGDHERMRARLGEGGLTLHEIIQRSASADTHVPLAGPQVFEVGVPRVLRRGARRWAGLIHEQPVELSGHVGHTSGLPGIVLHHVGYQAEILAAKEKGARNVARAREQVSAAEHGPQADLVAARVNLARSLSLVGEFAEMLELSDEIIETTPGIYGALLARSAVEAAVAVGDDEAVDRWLDIWADRSATQIEVLHRRARVLASRGDAAGALDVLDQIPTTTIGAGGVRYDRAALVHIEVWALATSGRPAEAAKVAARVAARGTAPGSPDGLARALGEHLRTAVENLDQSLWRDYVSRCVVDATPGALRFLDVMAEVRPGDGAVLAAAVVLTPTLTIEDAVTWSTRLRQVGDTEHCPLVAISRSERFDPRGRALAGAFAVGVFGDERGLAGLGAALELVAPEDEAALLAEIEVVAPGLVAVG